jgi:hypothetical protein
MLKGSVVYLAASEGALDHKVVLEAIRLSNCSIIGISASFARTSRRVSTTEFDIYCKVAVTIVRGSNPYED